MLANALIEELRAAQEELLEVKDIEELKTEFLKDGVGRMEKHYVSYGLRNAPQNN
jgi:hypothetical protein